MNVNSLHSPAAYLREHAGPTTHDRVLTDYDAWWRAEGANISEAVDRAGTPWLRMFDKAGSRIDEIVYQPDYWRMLRKGYENGVLWRAFEDNSLLRFYELLYIVSFYDPGLACPYTVSLSTAVPISKYGDQVLKNNVLSNMLRSDGTAWQGATWMTEIKGGSDLGTSVETVACRSGDHWLLTGDKYFASNVGADVAVIAARPENAPRNVRGLALFVVPRRRRNGDLNYFIRRMKDKIATRSVPTGEVELRDSEAFLLGGEQSGIYVILEVLNISRVANSIGAVALAQRALADAMAYAQTRTAFGKRVIHHPLLRRQFDDRLSALHCAFALAWESARLLDEVWQERPPYSDRYHMFRLVAHLAKYWTAEFAAQTAKWAMEVHGGVGTLREFGGDRWLREAMILAIWEGTSHRQILDGLEVMEKKAAHELLLQHLAPYAAKSAIEEVRLRIGELLKLDPEERQASVEAVFGELAQFVGNTLANNLLRTAGDSPTVRVANLATLQ